MGGPLEGLRVVELVGLGPGPFCGMVLADMGAQVLRVDRLHDARAADRSKPATNPMNRGKQSIALDLKHPDGLGAFLRLVEQADAMFEVFRPGVAERLGLGPGVCLERNPRLVYGRLTGWGQDGPYAPRAGHDIDYLALAGALEPLGRADEKPTPPINVLADFAGGGLLLAFGIACAIWERDRAGGSGAGQVIDAAMVDGAAMLMTPFYTGRASGGWGPRGTNFIDTGAPFYDTYETADGKFVAIGAIEPQFYAQLRTRLGLEHDPELDDPWDRTRWPAQRARFTELFREKTRDEWTALLDGVDACFAPVLDPVEAPHHPHNVARRSFLDVRGVPQPAPAPRFSRTPAATPAPPQHAGDTTEDTLRGWEFTATDVAKLRDAGALL
ncbi:MAG: CoA transferase [Actinobacteria bacterium]|nr:CoA transferase [Actinomycetota bacterium]